jgi:excinuclease UvrABC nuclease subunit
MTEITWSDWLDFNSEQAAKTPESPGVYMMHAAMKILYIGNAHSLRHSITESLGSACVCDAKRFRYSVTDDHVSLKEKLLNEYKEKHDGKSPKCME